MIIINLLLYNINKNKVFIFVKKYIKPVLFIRTIIIIIVMIIIIAILEELRWIIRHSYLLWVEYI